MLPSANETPAPPSTGTCGATLGPGARRPFSIVFLSFLGDDATVTGVVVKENSEGRFFDITSASFGLGGRPEEMASDAPRVGFWWKATSLDFQHVQLKNSRPREPR